MMHSKKNVFGMFIHKKLDEFMSNYSIENEKKIKFQFIYLNSGVLAKTNENKIELLENKVKILEVKMIPLNKEVQELSKMIIKN